MIAMNNLENLATAIGTDIKDLKMQTANSQEKISANTESLNRIATQMDSLVTKSEIKQDIDGLAKAQADSIRQEILNATKDKADKTLVVAEAGKLREEFSKMKVGSRNYAEDYDFSRGLWRYHQGDNSPRDWTISNGEYNVKGTTNTWKQMQIFSKEGSRVSEKDSTALLDLEIGETYTLSFQAMCHSGNPRVWVSLRANRTVPGNPEIISGTFNLTTSWQTYQVTIPALTKPDNFDFWRIILGYNEIGHVAFRKVELTRSSTRIDAGPAPEDAQTQASETQESLRGLERKFEKIASDVKVLNQKPEPRLTLIGNTLGIAGGNNVTLPLPDNVGQEIRGTGSPEGRITAEIGTTYVDVNVTNGALKWIKESGNGNTGWRVLIGDTGWRTLDSVSKLGNSFVKVRRVNNLVLYQFGGLQWGWFGIVRRGRQGYSSQISDVERNCFIVFRDSIPTGFRTQESLIGNIYNDNGIVYGTWYVGGVTDQNHLRFQFLNPVPTDRDIGDIRVSSISYLTDDPWPTTLP